MNKVASRKFNCTLPGYRDSDMELMMEAERCIVLWNAVESVRFTDLLSLTESYSCECEPEEGDAGRYPCKQLYTAT